MVEYKSIKHYLQKLTRSLSLGLVILALLLGVVLAPSPAIAGAIGPFPNTPLSNFPELNGGVYRALVGPDRSIYITGYFTEVGGQSRNHLARILPDGTLDPSFDPNLNDVAEALALSSDGQTLYVGGDFTQVNGSVSRNRVAAFNVETGLVTSFDPNINSGVSAIVIDPNASLVYVGGQFTQVNGSVARNNLAAFTPDGTATSFNPYTDGRVTSLALSSDGQTLYAGGAFSKANGGTSGHQSVDRNKVAAFDTTNAAATAFNPNAGTGFLISVLSMTLSPDGQNLYAGGLFGEVNGSVVRASLAAFNVNNGVATEFNAGLQLGSLITALVVSPDGQTLYAGGVISKINGSIDRNNIAVINTNDGTVTSFNPVLDSSVTAIALDSISNRLYVGGNFTKVNGGTPSYFAAFQGPVSRTELTSAEGGTPVFIKTPDGTDITCADTLKEADASTQDTVHDYPLGLVEFCFDTDAENNQVNLTFVTDLAPGDVVARKYNPDTKTYFDIPDAVITETVYEGHHALKLTYTIEDNGDLDLDKNIGVIKDPVGLALAEGAFEHGSDGNNLARTGINTVLLEVVTMTVVVGSGLYLRRRYQQMR